MPTWPRLLGALVAGEPLSSEDSAWAMTQIMDGEATQVQIAGFAIALRAKGETVEELAGLAAAMLERAGPLPVDGPVVDTCGTGGDGAGTVNISTMAAVVVAGAGARVAKHGNRAASSACGSADVLEALGVVVDLPPVLVAECVAEAGIGFCFAPVFHPAMRHAAAARSELGVPTFFNFLGPLTNPARPLAQAVGVRESRMAGVMASVFAGRGATALVFRGEDGLDELTTTGRSRVWIVGGGVVDEATLDPAALGIELVGSQALRGGDAAFNAGVAREVFAGRGGAARDAVLLNAAAALATVDPVAGSLERRLAAGLERAAVAVDSGAAAAALDRWASVSRKLAATR